MQQILSWTIDGQVPETQQGTWQTDGNEPAGEDECRPKRFSESCHEGILDMQRPRDMTSMVEEYLSRNSELLERLSKAL
eukprot:scaffold157454_cov39-Prasinocladus_malaysianus.AAC.1